METDANAKTGVERSAASSKSGGGGVVSSTKSGSGGADANAKTGVERSAASAKPGSGGVVSNAKTGDGGPVSDAKRGADNSAGQKQKTLMMELMHLSRIWSEKARAAALFCGIPDSYRKIVMYLSRHPGASQKETAQFCGITTAAVNQTVKDMESKSYIRRESNETDKRASRLYLTEKGVSASEEVKKKLGEYDSLIASKLGSEKEKELASTLKELSVYIEREL